MFQNSQFESDDSSAPRNYQMANIEEAISRMALPQQLGSCLTREQRLVEKKG
jgi:hypothetical protein